MRHEVVSTCLKPQIQSPFGFVTEQIYAFRILQDCKTIGLVPIPQTPCHSTEFQIPYEAGGACAVYNLILVIKTPTFAKILQARVPELRWLCTTLVWDRWTWSLQH